MRTRPESLPIEFEHDGLEERSAVWPEMKVSQYTLPPGTDLSPYFADEPDGLCQEDHYGLVLDGEILVRYADGTIEPTRAGECFYWPAPHTAHTGPGVRFLAFTPIGQGARRLSSSPRATGPTTAQWQEPCACR